MADTVFRGVIPPLKAIDNGDGTFSVAVYIIPPIVGGTDMVFRTVGPPLRATDNGDGTYLLTIREVY